MSASAPTWRLNAKLLATFAWPTLIENVPSPLVRSTAVSTLAPIPTLAFPSVSPMELAARSSLEANSYALALEITVESLSSMPSFAPFITFISMLPTFTVEPSATACFKPAKSAYFAVTFVLFELSYFPSA